MTDKERKTQFIRAVVLMIVLVLLLVTIVTIVLTKIVPLFDTIFEEPQNEETVTQETEDILMMEIESTVPENSTEIQNAEPIPVTIPEVMCEAIPLAAVIIEEKDILEVNDSEEPEEEVEEEKWIVELNEEEFQDFCMLIFSESGAEIEEGQVAVAAVILNRIENPDFPDTFYGVMNQPTQFNCVNNGYIYSSIKKFEDLPQTTIDAAKRALMGEDPTEELLWAEAERLGKDPEKYAEGGALYFNNPKKGGYRSCSVQIQIGNHCFHKVWRD